MTESLASYAFSAVSARRFLWFVLFALSSINNVTPGDAADKHKPVQVGRRKQLFVDDYIVSTKAGVKRELGKVKKANGGKPIFTGGWFYGTVLHDEGRFKLWFRKFDNKGYGYAESRDGVHFTTKAQLKGINFAGDINLAVEIDPHATDPKHRFKAGYDAPGMAMGVAHSADGIHWTPYNNGKPITYRAADCHNQIIWDEAAGVYRLFTRTDFGNGGGPLARTVAKNFEVRGTRSMVNPNFKANPTDWKLVRHWWFNRKGPKEYLRRQIYSMTCWIHHGVYFALMSVYEWPADVSEGKTTDLIKRHERDVMDFYIATSRDADHWDLTWVYSGKPIVPRGPDRSFDKDMVFPSSTIVTHADRHWLYYAGANERHGTFETDPPVRFKRHHAIGLATLRLDGFVCLAAKDKPGTVLTKPFKLEGDSLEVNVDATKGQVQVELFDASGRPIAGVSGDDAKLYKNVDHLRLRPKWSNRADLSRLKGQTVRLRFRLRNAKLYSFQIR